MKTYTITTESGTRNYSAETQAGALREHTSRFPGESVLGITESGALRAQSEVLASSAD